MRCSKCAAENRDGARFCNECAAPLAAVCPKCGATNKPGAKFCDECSAAIGVSTSPVRPKAPAPSPAIDSEDLEGERKTVTALFADIKGSTELEQDLDPEEARAIIDPALRLMIEAAQRYDGYVVQSTGDGIFAIFGAPVAHEDHPQRALYAALRMQEELKKYSARLREAGNLPIEARVGVNTGEVVVRSITTGAGHTEYTPIGHTANLASRMQALAPTGSIAISENTRKFVEGYFALKALGPTKVKGVSDAVNVYEVTGLGPLRTRLQRSAGRGLSKFVGRDREMSAMKAAAERALAGHGQIVAAMAEAGTGKSRLFFEFKAVSQSGWMVLETFSVSHGKASAYMPVIDLLHGYFGIEGEDDARKRREKVGGKVLMLDRALEDALPYLFALLGIVEGDDPLAQMDAQIKKRRTLDAIKRIILRESLNQPLMVIFEDLHWIDDETQALLNLLADSIPNSKILMLVNYRPEYSHQWNSKTYYTQLRLDPLGKENADEMLTAMVGDAVEIRPLKSLIIERTQGNPFFMEETVQVLLDEGALVRDGAAARLTKPLGELKIPPTVQAILAARIDRLAANEKDLLQTLAVIGKEFPLSLVRTVLGTDLTPVPFPHGKGDALSNAGSRTEELDRMLSELQLAEFVYEQPAVGDIEYTFKHALTQEVAYNSILSERRKQLHERIGAAIETLFSDSLDDHIAELAHHYARSGNIRRAATYQTLAGTQARKRGAIPEAIACFTAALNLVRGLPESATRGREELALQLMLADSLRALKSGHSEVEQAYLLARDHAIQLGDEESAFLADAGLRWVRRFRHEFAAARELGERMLATARRLRDPSKTVAAHVALGDTLFLMGDPAAARDNFARVLEIGDAKFEVGAEVDIMMVSVACAFLSFAIWLLGFPEQSAKLYANRLEEATQKIGSDARGVLAAFTTVARLMGNPKTARVSCDESIAIASQLGQRFFEAVGIVVRGWAIAKLGDPVTGIDEIERGMAMMREGGALVRSFDRAGLAEAYAIAGKPRDGLEQISIALAEIERTGERCFESELHRLNGEILSLLSENDLSAIERSYRTAIEVARNQGAKSFELRATVSLARLLDKQGNRDEARAVLSDIYNWFTEGFDTADLKDAKALLDELSA